MSQRQCVSQTSREPPEIWWSVACDRTVHKALHTTVVPQRTSPENAQSQAIVATFESLCGDRCGQPCPGLGTSSARARTVSVGQANLENGAAIVARADRAAVPLDDGFHDRKAEATAAGRLARRVCLVEAIEDQRQMLGGNARSRVAY